MTSMPTKKAEVILASDNYFHWEFSIRMKQERKGLLVHVQMLKDSSKITKSWLLNGRITLRDFYNFIKQ